jgi:Fe-S cluster assembly protein SufD
MISSDPINTYDNKYCEVKNSIISKNSVVLHQVTDLDFIQSSSILHKIILEQNSQYQLRIMLCHVKQATIEIEVDAQGDQSSFEIVFLYALSTDQKITIITRQKHTGQKTESKFYARGIVKGNAVVHHQGLILIEENGQKTESFLEHKALVLGTNAQVVLVPSIEVLNHDVQCSHGAAVGQFQQEHVWYLRSRGFDENQVYQILIRSFFSEFIEKFDQPEKLLESLCQKIV